MTGQHRTLLATVAAGALALTMTLQGQTPEPGRGFPAQDWSVATGPGRGIRP